jgi:hypothetical protein
MYKKLLLIAYFILSVKSETHAAQVTSVKSENIPNFPEDYQKQQFIKYDNELNLSDFGRRYDNFISTIDGYELYSSVMNGNEDATHQKNGMNIDVDYSYSQTTRTRIMANTMLIMLDSPEYLSNETYSYFIINNDLK